MCKYKSKKNVLSIIQQKRWNSLWYYYKWISIILGISILFCQCSGKYVEGHLKTLDNWAFLARFCFLSGRGRYEYHIEFERRYGEIQLLLYYDDKTQWPAVYKSGKTCQQKLQVLSVVDNQIVTLSARSSLNVLSGCTLKTKYPPKSSDPNDNNVNNINNNENPLSTTRSPSLTDFVYDSTYFDQFLYTTTSSTLSSSSVGMANNDLDIDEQQNITTEINNLELFDTEMLQYNFTGFNDTEDISNQLNDSTGGRLALRHDIVYENVLENTTDFLNDIEELFQTYDHTNRVRIRRRALNPQHFAQMSSSTQSINKRKDRGAGTLIVSCNNIGGFTSSRERWWYIAVANCGTGKGLDIQYKFRMTNGPPGDFWHEHFSADEMYIPPILFSSCISYTFLLVAIFLCAIELKTLHLFHCTYRLFALSAMLQWIGILCQGVAWTKYGLTGLGPQTTLGGLLMGASEVSYLCLLLVMAKGYTITRARLSSCSTIKLTIFINIYIVLYITLFIYQAEAFDPGEVLNLYESPAGFGLAGLRCASWGAFLLSTATTIRKYPEKQHFYYPFGLLGSLWILGGPLLTIIGIGILDAWVRESVMCATLNALAFGGHICFLYLTWPSRANKSFPYHVRTNHVGIASDDDDGADYPRHTYSPSVADQNIIIPLTRRTEELLSGVYNQYVLEQQVYNSNSTPHSHISFPNDPSAPPISLAATTTNIANASYNSDDETILATDSTKRDLSKLTAAVTSRNREQQLPHNIQGDDNIDDHFIDSGHPSLENSISNTNDLNELNSTPSKIIKKRLKQNDELLQQNQLLSSQQKDNISESSIGTGALKNNPFIVNNGIKRQPNKVILEPIEQPIRVGLGNVPKHLFVVKKSSSATTAQNTLYQTKQK